MRFVNLSATSEKVGKGHKKRLILRKAADAQSAELPVLAFGDADTGFFQSSDDVLELTTAGVSRMKWDASGITTVSGNLVVSGTTTTIGSTTLTVDDKNIELGSVVTPSDTTADGGGITLKGATDKTFNWINSTDAWTSSEHINLASGKTFQLNGAAISASAAELNILDGVTSTASEINILDGVTATTAELNYTDGVTSAIQTQMNTKLASTTAASTYAPLASPTFTGNVGIGTALAVGTGATVSATTLISARATNVIIDAQSAADSQKPGFRAGYQDNDNLAGLFRYSTGDAQLYVDNFYQGNNGVYSNINFRNCPNGSAGEANLVTRMTIHGSTGHITPGADNTQNLGSASLRWANIYTADMHLSNEGKEGGNEIDGTTGEWTIQEGDENIFVINKKTGKKFKIDLTEV